MSVPAQTKDAIRIIQLNEVIVNAKGDTLIVPRQAAEVNAEIERMEQDGWLVTGVDGIRVVLKRPMTIPDVQIARAGTVPLLGRRQ